MISLKRFLGSDGDQSDSHSRVVWLILEAVACHAIQSDASEREAFQATIRSLVSRLEQSASGAESFVLAGEAIKSIETYNRGVQRALSSQIKELQSILFLFTRSMLQLSKGSAASAAKLHQIEHQIEKSSQTEDLRAIKAQLQKSLESICEEATEQEQRGAQITDQIRETMTRPEGAEALSEAVGDLDLVTGLPNFRAAQLAIRSAIAANTNSYAVLLCVDRLEVINGRFGFGVGDKILMLFGQHLAQRLTQNDRLFRWRGPGFLALIERAGPEMSIRAEIARLVSGRLEQEIDLGERSILLPIASSWMLASVANSTLEKVSQKLDAFAASQPGQSPSR